MVKTGLEILASEPRRWLPRGARVGLLLNPASLDSRLAWSRDVLREAIGGDLGALFSPQHGIFSDVQDNMVESRHGRDRRTGLPVWSLYSETRKPTGEMLDGIDVLVADLQDVGTRVYTFVWTLRLVMEACGERGVRVVVLDRPNPLGGAAVEGNRLVPECASFVGLDPVPMRHGMTPGELALWFRGERGVSCELSVVPLEGWRREMLWPETGLPWVMPSPNMPVFETALVYPGTVLFEGTTASEGRGTTRPFEIVGGPWVDGEALAEELRRTPLPGAVFRPVGFQPTFQKWAGRPCGGVQIHVTEPRAYRPYRTGIALLGLLWRRYRSTGFGWREPPYEYEKERLPINLLLGDERVREELEAGCTAEELESGWAEGLSAWEEERAPYLLYG
ncbi:MAG: DUF1343 domain-containing protein [Deltaproteobacteria bacterium]|nr:DUF1343 domain-containing protein [Deltaproteobacteria bacterium]